VIPYTELDGFIDEVFGIFLEVRRVNRQLLEALNIRRREQSLVIRRVGDIFLAFATEFRAVYLSYVGNLPLAEKRLKEETKGNNEFRLFLEVGPLFVLISKAMHSCVESGVECKPAPRRSEDGAQGVLESTIGARAEV
jgi:RhoGEF domain